MDLEGMLYLNGDKQVCLASWSTNGKMRHYILLDKVDRLDYRFFDPHKKDWREEWPSHSAEIPPMIHIDLYRGEQSIPFTFFPSHTKHQISYYGIP